MSKKRGPKKKTWPISKIIKHIEEDKCNPYVNSMAKAAGCSWITMKKIVEKSEKLQTVMKKRQEELVEKSEMTYWELLDSTNPKVRLATAKWVSSQLDEKYQTSSKIQVDVDGEFVFRFGNVLNEDEDIDEE